MARGLAIMMGAPEEESEEMEESFVFQAPEGFEPPDTAQAGSPFEATVQLYATEDGRLRIASLNGIPMGEREEIEEIEEEEEDMEEPTPPGSLREAMDQEMAGIRY